MRLEPRCCRTSIWYTIFVVVVVVLVDIQNMELVLTNIFTLCWQYIPQFGKFGCEPFGRAAPYKKRGVNIPIFHVLEGPPKILQKRCSILS